MLMVMLILSFSPLFLSLFERWLLVTRGSFSTSLEFLSYHSSHHERSSGVTLGLVLHVAGAKSVSAKIINQATGRRSKEREE